MANGVTFYKAIIIRWILPYALVAIFFNSIFKYNEHFSNARDFIARILVFRTIVVLFKYSFYINSENRVVVDF